MVNLAYTKADLAEEKLEDQPGGSQSKYPWGLNITLDDETLAKLGIDVNVVKSGQTMDAHITLKVTGTSTSMMASGDNEACVNCTITDMDLGGNGPSDADRAAKMYDK